MRLLLLLCWVLAAQALLGQTSIMSYNIRYDNPDDGPDWWEHRKTEVVALLQYYAPDFIGLQEALPQQTDFIDQSLPTHQYIGFGRDGEGTESEGAPIFYRPDRYELIASEVLWLSETPEQVSRGWDAALNRITTYGVFRERSTGDTLHIFNCHFDHRGVEARAKSAQLLVDLLAQKQLQEKAVVLMGDLNCEPQDEPMKILLEYYTDAFDGPSYQPYGPEGTFNGFDTQKVVTARIDYILTRGTQNKSHRIIDDRRTNNRYPSDHFPVWVRLHF